MAKREQQIIPARRGVATRLLRGQRIRVINTHGSQVVDTWAFCDPDLGEFMSMEHSRSALNSIFLRKGDTAITNQCRPILSMIEDTSDRIHDTLVAACSLELYREQGIAGPHDNCTDNLRAALAGIGLVAPEVPCPWNLFQHTPVDSEGRLDFPAPPVTPGCFVVLRAECDCVVVFSACPWDLPDSPINGPDGKTADCHFEID